MTIIVQCENEESEVAANPHWSSTLWFCLWLLVSRIIINPCLNNNKNGIAGLREDVGDEVGNPPTVSGGCRQTTLQYMQRMEINERVCLGQLWHSIFSELASHRAWSWAQSHQSAVRTESMIKCLPLEVHTVAACKGLRSDALTSFEFSAALRFCSAAIDSAYNR